MAFQRPDIDRYGRFTDSGSGLLVPESYARLTAPGTSMAQLKSALETGFQGEGFNGGVQLTRDPNTFAVKWPAKGCGQDDLISQYIVDGQVANIGLSPVVAPQISAMVKKQQQQSVTASVDVTGRKTPMKKARDAIARFNDSPLGATDAIQTLVYRLCTYNRGAPIATVPITYAVEEWGDYGMTPIPILAEGEKEEAATKFYLEVDWSRVGTPVPFLVNPLELEPTGVTQWPYWYRTKRSDGTLIWVLLHSSQIIEVLSGKGGTPGIGNSAVWMSLGILAEQILVIEERSEKMLYSLTDGIILLGGVSLSGETIEQRVEEGREAKLERGFKVAKGHTIINSPQDKVSYVQINFRQPSGIPFKDWREYAEDVVSFCFGEPLSTMVTRGGVGFGAGADVAADNAAESGVGAHLEMVGIALGSIYPRVQVSVSRPNDRAQRLNIETLGKFATAAGPLIDKKVLTPEQATAIIDRDIISIPPVDTSTSSANVNDDQDGGETSAGNGDETTTESQTASGTANSGTATQSALRALLDEAHQFAPPPLYEDAEVTITHDDVDQALLLARRRVDDRVYGLLTAEPVEA